MHQEGCDNRVAVWPPRIDPSLIKSAEVNPPLLEFF
jgi:hypothetical protein